MARDFVADTFTNTDVGNSKVLTKNLAGNKNMCRVTYTGTYTGVTSTFYGSNDGSSYVALTGIREDTGAKFNNSVSAANFSVLYNTGGFQYVKEQPSAVSTGTLNVAIDTGANFQLPIGVTPITAASVAQTITSASATAFQVGPNGSTNPSFNIDASASSAATGFNVAAAAAASGLALSVISSGTNENLKLDAKGSGTITLASVSTGAVVVSSSLTVTSTSANALAVGANGTTNPVLKINANTASVATGLSVTGAAAAGGLAVAVISSGTNENLTLDAKGSGTITIAGTSTGAVGISSSLTVTSSSANGLAVGANGTTNPVLKVVCSTASVATGLSITGAAAAGGLAVAVISSGTNEALTLDAKGSGTISIGTVSTGAITLGAAVSGSSSIKSAHATAGIGYGTGAGGTVTQITSKSTGVTLNKIVGAITMHNAALADATNVKFALTNSAIAATDVVIVNHSSAGTSGAYEVWASNVGSGSCDINVRNVSGGSLGEAIVLSFAVIKGVTS